jgi:site-specific recombinase XerD
MSNAGIPLRVIQQISGHRSLGVLQEYLEAHGVTRGLKPLLNEFHSFQPPLIKWQFIPI